MATKPIYAFYVDRFTDAEWSNETGWLTPRFVAVQEAFALAMADAGISSSDGSGISTYRYGVNAGYDKKLGLSGIAEIPQILFATPDPSRNDNSVVFLAKLVNKQINRKNIELMLKTVRSLSYKIDPTTGEVSFYDPTFRLFGDTGFGFNPASAPGGSLIGLGLQERLTLNRTGQVIDNIISLVKKLFPFLVAGALYYGFQEKKRK